MKYFLEDIQKKFIEEIKLKYVFFWGHQPLKDGSISKSCLSQWWDCIFEIDGVVYHSAEQYMMAEKALLFGDLQTRDKILQSRHPKNSKNLGKSVLGFSEELWVEKRFNIVKKGNLAKFSQNNDLKLFLLQTQDSILVEASPTDNIWGIGLAAEDADAENPTRWKGLNLLGFALMEVRDELKS